MWNGSSEVDFSNIVYLVIWCPLDLPKRLPVGFEAKQSFPGISVRIAIVKSGTRFTTNLDEANTVSHTILDLSRSKLDPRSQVWEGFKQIGWKPVYFRHFDVQKKSFRSQIPHFTSKIFLLFKKFGFSSPNSIFINSTPATSVTIHPRHFKLFFCTSKCLNYPSFTGICDRGVSFWHLVSTLLLDPCSKVWTKSQCYKKNPDRTVEHPKLLL